MIAVRVYNYAGASTATLAAAEAEGARILLKSGVRTTWLDCPLKADEIATHPACQEAFGPTDLVLRILPRKMAERMPFHHSEVGFAQQPSNGQQAYLASIFYHRVEKLADDLDFSRGVILGHALAHEIGHLLLGPNRHALNGIMRASWNREDLINASRGGLLFLPQQSARIRAEVLSRVQASRTAKDSMLMAGH